MDQVDHVDHVDTDPINWIYYLIKYPDLLAAKITTREAVLSHYLLYGKSEGRSTQCKLSDRSIRTCLERGLFNQLQSLLIALGAAHVTGCHLYVESFLPDYSLPDRLPFSELMDIPQLNKILLNHHIQTTCHEVDPAPDLWKRPEYILIQPYIPYGAIHLLSTIMHHPYQYIDIGSVFYYPFMDVFFSAEYKEKVACVLRDLPFRSIYYEVRDYCLNYFNLTEFAAVHLRLEDDIVNYHSPTQLSELKENYLRKMRELFSPSTKIFLATYLGKAPNLENSFLEVIKEEFPNTVYWTSTTWRSQFPDVIKGREIDALIDYLVCRQAIQFIGYKLSTFSESLLIARHAENKHAEYVDTPEGKKTIIS